MQTVACSGVLADEFAQLVVVSPSDIDRTTYKDSGIVLAGRSQNSLKFECSNAPQSDITVLIRTIATVRRLSPCLTFSSDSAFTIKASSLRWDGIIESSTDQVTWNTWDGTILTALSDGLMYNLYIRGTNNTKISSTLIISGKNVSCDGNIETLLDWETVDSGGHPTMASSCFYGLFDGCSSLIQAPQMPAAERLPGACYEYMFRYCTSLISAPDLPAKSVGNVSYYGMFWGCTSLKAPPVISATEMIGSSACGSMFSGCIALETPPQLLATVLSTRCYELMFSGCTSLTSAPELPANELAMYCYKSMFSGCTSLIIPPILPAKETTQSCYESMFSGCTALNGLPTLPAITLGDRCYYGMFSGCTKIKLSSSQNYEYTQPYRIPPTGAGTAGSNSFGNMFTGTGGTKTSDPSINTTYYLSHDNQILQ